MKKKDNVTIGIVCFALLLTGTILLTTGKKSENTAENGNAGLNEEVLFEGLGNNQGNTENGGEQTWLDMGYIVLKLSLDDSKSRMVFFNTSDGTLELACEDTSCLHTGSLCSSKQLFRYLVSWSNDYYGVSDTYTKEILKCTDSEVTCFYKADNDIYGLWGYEGYLYFSTDYGVYRVPLKGEAEAEQVLNSPILVGLMLTFYEDRMYFCDEDKFLYSAALDGTDKKRLSDGMAYYPQIHDDRIYYRSAQYDANGIYEMENTLCSMTLDGEDKQIVLDEVYQFNCLDDRIYYITLPNDGETTLHSIEYDGTDCREIVDCQAGYLYVFDETDWILYMKTEGELQEDEVGGKPGHLYCIKKDGTQETRLDYPQIIGE